MTALTSSEIMKSFRHLVGILELWISPFPTLDSTTHKNSNIHLCLEWDSKSEHMSIQDPFLRPSSHCDWQYYYINRQITIVANNIFWENISFIFDKCFKLLVKMQPKGVGIYCYMYVSSMCQVKSIGNISVLTNK
jgi:hypothetical protein